jgi:hypothetical protein
MGPSYNWELTSGTALVFAPLCREGVFYAAHLYAICANMQASVPATLTVDNDGLTIESVTEGLTQRVHLAPRAIQKGDALLPVTLDAPLPWRGA